MHAFHSPFFSRTQAASMLLRSGCPCKREGSLWGWTPLKKHQNQISETVNLLIIKFVHKIHHFMLKFNIKLFVHPPPKKISMAHLSPSEDSGGYRPNQTDNLKKWSNGKCRIWTGSRALDLFISVFLSRCPLRTALIKH